MSRTDRNLHVAIDDEARMKRIQKVVDNFTYKRGWSFRVEQRYDIVRFEAKTTVSPSPGRTQDVDALDITFPVEFSLHMFETDLEASVLLGLRTAIRSGELHEMDEWCIYKGQRRWDPHQNTDF